MSKLPLTRTTLAVILGFVILAGCIAFAVHLVRRGSGAPASLAPRSTPTVASYRSEARDVMVPFFEQTLSLSPASIQAPPEQLRELVGKTQERLLRLVVPGDEREAHLATVLLLEQWKRALSGSADDRTAALEKTRAHLSAYPWLAP